MFRRLFLAKGFGLLIAFLSTACFSIPKRHPDLSRQKKAKIQKNLQALLAELSNKTNLALSVVSMRTGTIIYTHNEQKAFLPASVIKLYTAAAALHYLGPSFRYQTTLTSNQLDRNKQSIGDLILNGSGDPSFKSEHLQNLISQLKQQKITQINGDVVVNSSIFDDVGWAKGWMWDDLHRGFSAPIYGLNIDSNQVIIRLKSAQRPKQPPQIFAYPINSYFAIENQALTQNFNASHIELVVKSPYSKTFEIWPKAHEYGLEAQSVVRITGVLGLQQTQYLKLALSDPMQFAAQLIVDELKKAGIKVLGKVRMQKTIIPKPNTFTLATYNSRQLSEALIDFMKISNDHALESLVKTIAAKQNSSLPASFDAGLNAIDSFLVNQVGLNPKSFQCSDGSGTSRYNLVSAAQTTQLLEYIYYNFQMFPELIASLPFQDGTLIKRFDKELAQRIRAKTGYLNNVYALAGFIDVSEDIFAFAIFNNGSLEGASENFLLQKRILESLLIRK